MIHQGQLGIHPPGALGVGFFVHARADCFIGRGGDGITEPLRKAGSLRLDDGGKLQAVPLRNRIFSNLLEADALDHLPELLFVCCNPDQLGLFGGEMTRFLENLAGRGRLNTVEDVRRCVPILLILPNGILAEQTVRAYEEQLRESLLMGRLPGVTEEMVAVCLDRLVRGISLQAAGRRGSGNDTVYVLERIGSVVFAGGGDFEGQRIEAILAAHDYPFDHARGVPGTRIEFDKAMVSIVLNVGGLIHTVRPNGELIDLRMADLCRDPAMSDFVQRITRAVFDVGRAVGAYPPDADYYQTWATHRATILAHAGHVTSSVKTLRDALADGLDGVKLFSNEEWILTPLCRYATNAGLHEEEKLFKSLRHQVQQSMARAIHHRERDPLGTDPSPKRQRGVSHSRAVRMKLVAQRNISVELYDAGSDNMCVVATMLDDVHLIKLEVNIYLPDEQITRSKLNMIRAPFPVCREVEPLAERLIGLRIERGVLSEISRRVGGQTGCSHIKELAINIVYFAAANLVLRRTGVDPMSTDYAHKLPEERFTLTKELLRDSCLAYCQATSQGLDEQIGIKRVGPQHTNPLPLGEHEPSLGVLLRDRARKWGSKVFLRHRVDDRELAFTWKEFAERTFQIARHLMEQGIRQGDRICVLSENRAEMFMAELATMSIGAVTVPIFAGYLPRQITYVLEHARPRYLVVSGQHQLDKIERGRHPSVEKYYCMDFDSACREWGAIDFATLTDGGGATLDRLEERVESVQPPDLCMVMYTSGTTGPPKGVKLCHRNIISQQKAVSLIWDIDENDVFLSYLPWHHSFGGLFERFMPLYNGSQLCLDDSRGRDIDRLIDNWKAFSPTLFFSVPRVHELLVTRCREHSEISDTVYSGRLRFVFTAGAPLPAQVESAYREHNIPVLEGWGLTETSPCVTLTTIDSSWRSGYVGAPLPGVAVRIDSDQEILVKGSNVMDGYLDDEEATSHVIDRSGWFRTGDLGEFTDDGLRIFGRKDGAFKLTTGEKVHPLRIENLLVNESPYVGLALALGSGKDFVGVLIYPDFSRLRRWASEHGVPVSHPQGATVQELIDQPAVRELYASELERLNPHIEVKFQRVRRAVLVGEEPSLANGELTASGKTVRKAVLERHQDEVEDLFASRPSTAVIEVQKPQLQRA
ncbi:MAG: AMP-binding protein [Phycisphaerae bacterium]